MLSKTYIIIVTYNAMPWLDKCLGSIDFKRYKVVIVDNNSSDGTVSHIISNYEEVKLFQENSNLGFGQGNNKGISYALQQGAEHVFLLNQDAYLIGDCLEQLINVQEKSPNYGILSPVHTNASITRLDRNFSNYVQFDRNPDFYSDHVLGNELNDVYEVPFVNAAGWLISKECLMTVGGFDPIFFHYGEDDNFCQRVRYHGFKIGVLSNVFMIHDREKRKKPKFEPFSEAYFKAKVKSFKVKNANINLDSEKASNLKKKYRRRIFKEWLEGNFLNSWQIQKEFEVLKVALLEVKDSRERNINEGAHYLEIK